MSELLEVEGLGRDYGQRRALAGLSFRLDRGEVLGLLGPNGAGKSTTLRMLAGTLAPSRGRIAIDGIDLVQEPMAARARIGYLPENPPLYRELTVDEYLGFCAALHQIPAPGQAGAIQATKGACGLGDMGRRLIGNLSKGYQQRVGIAQAILHDPPLVILDEPTTGLDPNQIRDIRALIRRLGEGRAVILSTHILAEVQATCDRVMILHQGRCVFAERLAVIGGGGAPTMRVRLAEPPPVEQLAGIEGVAAAAFEADGVLRLRLHAETSPEAIAVALIPWGLREFAPEREELERIFMRLTLGEAEDRDKPKFLD